ncbi:MAG: hypothetical protein ACKO8H_08915, partial [Microcystis panniformis]
ARVANASSHMDSVVVGWDPVEVTHDRPGSAVVPWNLHVDVIIIIIIITITIIIIIIIITIIILAMVSTNLPGIVC